MENRVSYIIIGLFVFILFGATIGFVLWLGKYNESQAFSYYKVVTKESVSGLNEKAPVKLRGVSVGEVREIFIDSKNSEEVIVLIRVQEGTPIKEDTYATLVPQGITGLNFIELQGGSNQAKMLKTSRNRSEYGIIKSKSSMFSRLDSTLEMIGNKTETILTKTDSVMSERNIKNIEIILENLAKTTDNLNRAIEGFSKDTRDVKKILTRALEVEQTVIDASKKVGIMSEHISTAINNTGIDTMNSMRSAAHRVSSVMGSLEGKIEKGTFDVDILLKENLQPMQSAMHEFRLLMIEARTTLGKLSDSPSDFLYKQRNIQPAPSEEK